MMEPSHEQIRSKSGPSSRLSAGPAEFWSIDPELLVAPKPGECEPALKRFGPLPVVRGTFPLMGFFATVYEHVSVYARNQTRTPE